MDHLDPPVSAGGGNGGAQDILREVSGAFEAIAEAARIERGAAPLRPTRKGVMRPIGVLAKDGTVKRIEPHSKVLERVAAFSDVALAVEGKRPSFARCQKLGCHKRFAVGKIGNIPVFCTDCKKEKRNEQQRKRREANREKFRERDRKRREANREKRREQDRKHREANREKRREQDRKHREANREKLREQDRKRREANREKRNEQERKRREANREKIREQDRKRREANREKRNEQERKRREANREKLNEQQRKRRAAAKKQ